MTPGTRTGRAPVLIPAPQGWAGRANVRGLRVRVTPDLALVLERPRGGVRVLAAPGAVTSVVLVPDPVAAGVPATTYGAGSGSADAHGLLVALAGERPVLALRVAEWVPSPAELDGRTARAVSGANALAAAFGRALEPGDPAALAARAKELRAVLVSPRATLPAAYRGLLALGAAALAVWFLGSAIGGSDRHQAFGWAGAAAALLLTGTWVALRQRAHRPLPAPPGVEVAPAPAEPLPAAFLRSRLYVSPEWLVIADGVGREGWLPGPALGGVTAAAFTAEAVVLDDADGTGLAALPRAAWCGRAGSEQSLRAALARAGVADRDEPSSRAPGAWLAAPYPLRALDDPLYAGMREARGVPALAGVLGGIGGGMVAVGALGFGEHATALAAALAAATAVATWAADTVRRRRDARLR